MSNSSETSFLQLVLDNLAVIISFLVGAGAAIVKLMMGRITDAVDRNTEAVNAQSEKIDHIYAKLGKIDTRITVLEEKHKE